jgi:threonine synthase
MLTGLARDGGLYLPESIPQMSHADIAALEGVPYEEAAFRIMRPYLGDAFSDDEYILRDMTGDQLARLIEEVGRETVSEKDALDHVKDMLIDRTELSEEDFVAGD